VKEEGLVDEIVVCKLSERAVYQECESKGRLSTRKQVGFALCRVLLQTGIDLLLPGPPFVKPKHASLVIRRVAACYVIIAENILSLTKGARREALRAHYW